MILAIAWKEYREQRSLWLAVALLATLLVFAIASMAPGGIWQAHADVEICRAMTAIAASVGIAYGVASGAMLLAAEKETGTLAFLDVLSPMRDPVWRAKLLIGTGLALAQGLFLSALTYTLYLGHESALNFLLLPVGALVFGIVGGTVCNSVFPAILVGAIGTALTLFTVLTFFGALEVTNSAPPFWTMTVILIIVGIPACYGSWQGFCRHDSQHIVNIEQQIEWRLYLRGMWVVGWLTIRQGKWIFVSAIACIACGQIAYGDALEFFWFYWWPCMSLIIGLICGVATFSSEQFGRQESFLGAQRIPPGTFWAVKTLLWAGAALYLLGSLAYANFLSVHARKPIGVQWELLTSFQIDHPVLFYIQWPLYGFSFGQFFSLLTRKFVVAVFFAAVAASVALTIWVPSMFFGGLSAWQVLMIPLFVLLATRLTMWTWLSERLYTWKHIYALSGCAVFVLAWFVGNLWHRAVEVPDVGEPFDVAEYEAVLAQASRNPAPARIREALELWKIFRGNNSGLTPEMRWRYTNTLFGNSRKFPVDDRDIELLLFREFRDDWMEKLRLAVALPPGLMADPRHCDANAVEAEAKACRDVGLVLCVRAMQLHKRGDDFAALDHVDLVLALARHLRNHSPYLVANYGLQMEWNASFIDDMREKTLDWSIELRSKKWKLLRDHVTTTPSIIDNIKAEYVARRRDASFVVWFNNTTAFDQRVFVKALEFPWEQERYLRMLNAGTAGQLSEARATRAKPTRADNIKYMEEYKDLLSQIAFRNGLPLADGPTARLSPKAWGTLIKEAPAFWQYNGVSSGATHLALERICDLHARVNSRCELHSRLSSGREHLAFERICDLHAAASLYQVENGKAPPTLDDLAPLYIPVVPINPISHQPYFYRISAGEMIDRREFASNITMEKLAPGQGLLWMEDSCRDGEKIIYYFPLPLVKQKEPRPK